MGLGGLGAASATLIGHLSKSAYSPSATNGQTRPGQTSVPTQLTISAAASLQNALIELDPLFEQAYPHTQIFYNWGGSGSLQRQIEQGAPTDIFFPASPVQMQQLIRQNLVLTGSEASRHSVLSNQLVLIVPEDSPITGFADLQGDSAHVQQLAVGEFHSVPAGQYAEATLTALDLLPQLTPKLVFFSNVRGVLAAVENGHAEAGLVYRTDAELSNRVKVVATAPEQTHPPIDYPVAVLARSPHRQAAENYINFLSSQAAQQVFAQFGFIPTSAEKSQKNPTPALTK